MHSMPIDAKPMNADRHECSIVGLAKAGPPAQIETTIWACVVATDAPLVATAVSRPKEESGGTHGGF
jgi:hypothetical protein